MLSVVTTPLVNRKLDELFEILLEQNYFSDEENAYAYCNGIRSFIKSLAIQKHYFTIDKRWGVFYALHKVSRRTTWYILLILYLAGATSFATFSTTIQKNTRFSLPDNS